MSTRAVLSSFAALLLGATILATGQSASAASTRTWTGLGASNDWSDAANWDTGVPVAGDSLVFPAGASRKANDNDLAPNTSFESITFDGSDYVIEGNALDVSDAVRNQPSGGTNRILLAVGGPGEVVQQSGRLTLQGANTYIGLTMVTGGVLAITNSSALGDHVAGTNVTSPGTLQLSNNVDIGSERVTITGPGNADFGALQSVSGTNRADDVRVLGTTVIGVGNSTFVVEVLSQAAAGANFTLVGGGKLQVESAF
jgi:autotransporter-associated beta strand protein